ncbi:hypothetical protein C8R43DRAFT_1126301 [Mycena crocata]|nr:hypothetical protein C8R43DRAFT_1126301 [Mycena crocata]
MRFAHSAVMVALAAGAIASPARFKRGVNCTPTDDDGTNLTGSSVDSDNSFATCTYKAAGPCTYFFADGSFSSGSSTCPAGLPQNAATSGGGNTGASSGGSSTISSGINCTPTDDDGSALTASAADSDKSFATCTYRNAGICTYFFADGSFSSGSSTCPQGLPQTGGSGGGNGGSGTTTSNTVRQTETEAPPPPPETTKQSPPPETATSTPPPPPETTTSTPPPPPETSTSVEAAPSTSTSTFFSTVEPSSEAAPVPPSTEVPVPPTTPAAPTTPVAPTSTATEDDFTTVIVTPSASAGPTGGIGGVSNNGPNTGAAAGLRGSVVGAVVMPLVVVFWALL